MNKKLQDHSLTEYYLVLSIHGVNKMKSQLFIFMNIFMNKPIVKALGKRRPSPVLQTFSPPGGAVENNFPHRVSKLGRVRYRVHGPGFRVLSQV